MNRADKGRPSYWKKPIVQKKKEIRVRINNYERSFFTIFDIMSEEIVKLDKFSIGVPYNEGKEGRHRFLTTMVPEIIWDEVYSAIKKRVRVECPPPKWRNRKIVN